MNKIRYLLFTIVIMFISISVVSADELYSIKVNLILDEYGNGHIIETWDFNATKGTEIYRPMTNLGNSKITNFKAYMDDSLFTYVANWDVDGSLNDKAYKNGINYISDGLELCIGKTSYGRHNYVFEYDISNMIYNVEDAQMLFWKFINDSMGNAPHSFDINVSGPISYDIDLPVWGFGYEGEAIIQDGIIKMYTKDRDFKSSEYAVLLVKYPLNTFNTNNSFSKFKTFDDAYSMAMEGTFSYSRITIYDIISIIIILFFAVIFPGFCIIVVYFASKNGSYITTKIDMKSINSFRDIPCNKNLINAYFLSNIYNLSKKKEDFFGAVILKWVLDGQISIIKNNDKKETISLDFTKDLDDSTPLGDLYKMLKDASGDNILESKELEKWSTKNYNKLYSWFDKVEEYAKDNYLNKNLLTSVSKGKNVFSYTAYEVSPKLEEEGIKLAGLKKFLKEVSEIDKKQPIEVKLWEYYLIYAQIFGIAKKVAKQFKDLYPEIVKQFTDDNFDYTTFILLNNMSMRTVNAASSARSSSYSSGGGGHSYGGGGGGSFGGGSGGGGR